MDTSLIWGNVNGQGQSVSETLWTVILISYTIHKSTSHFPIQNHELCTMDLFDIE